VSPPKLPEIPPSKWKPRHHIGIYDYNYKVGESYYNPQTKYINQRPAEARPHDTPPESQTYAERFASNPIYGSAHGLPYAETQSVFRQPVAAHTVGTRSRAASLSRDSGVSQYLSSLGTTDTFNRADSKLSRQLADPLPIPSKPLGTSFGRGSVRDELADSRRVNSLPPLKRRFENSETSYKHQVLPTPRPTTRTQEGNSFSLGDFTRSRKPSPLDQESANKSTVNLRSRRSSYGGLERNESLERKVKDEISNITYGKSTRDEGPRYRSSQYFRDARRLAETEDLNRMVDKLRRGSWGSSRQSRGSLRT